ncbi:MAG: hypothetical protein ACRCXZ_00660 [Patescibacteria group bacterium]
MNHTQSVETKVDYNLLPVDIQTRLANNVLDRANDYNKLYQPTFSGNIHLPSISVFGKEFGLENGYVILNCPIGDRILWVLTNANLQRFGLINSDSGGVVGVVQYRVTEQTADIYKQIIALA